MERTGFQSSNITVKELRKGDLLQIKRKVHSHWVVYVGNDEVIHLGTDPGDGSYAAFDSWSSGSKSDILNDKATVRRDKLQDVVKDSTVYRHNLHDGQLEVPYTEDEIVTRAEEQLRTTGYNVLTYNCEHFATFMRYGVKLSSQVKSASWDNGLSEYYKIQVIMTEPTETHNAGCKVQTKAQTSSRSYEQNPTQIQLRSRSNEAGRDLMMALMREGELSDRRNMQIVPRPMYEGSGSDSELPYTDSDSDTESSVGVVSTSGGQLKRSREKGREFPVNNNATCPYEVLYIRGSHQRGYTKPYSEHEWHNHSDNAGVRSGFWAAVVWPVTACCAVFSSHTFQSFSFILLIATSQTIMMSNGGNYATVPQRRGHTHISMRGNAYQKPYPGSMKKQFSSGYSIQNKRPRLLLT